MDRGARASGALTGLAVLMLAYSLPAARAGHTPVAADVLGAGKAQTKSLESAVTPDAEEPDRESLRYAGKSFQHWRQEAQTELKPELRLEALKALGFFGAAGYGPEAARVVIEAMRGCDFVYSGRDASKYPDEYQLFVVGSQAIGRMGPEAAPALRAGLSHANRSTRRFAISCLAYLDGDAQSLSAEIVRALNDRDPYVALQACNLAVTCCPHDEGLLSALGRAMQAKEEQVRSRAATALGQLGKEARPALEDLLEGIHDPAVSVRLACLDALTKLEADPQGIVQPLLRLMSSEKEARVLEVANSYFRYEGNRGVRLVPALVAVVKENGELREAAMLALAVMGPAARSAVPGLKEALTKAPRERRERLEEVIRILEGQGSLPPPSPNPCNAPPTPASFPSGLMAPGLGVPPGPRGYPR